MGGASFSDLGASGGRVKVKGRRKTRQAKMQSNADTMSVEVQGQIGNVPAGHEAFTVYYDYCFSFRECFFRRRLQPVNCAIVSCVELL